ncbi:hypothetical protein TWF696_003871 [Orbilia brochopaga]|uniref:Uncharacterized protein n=1 Tax=Orbilia brochopaga TaxID=3140254 RepID=A0AAV9V536_9PEZI
MTKKPLASETTTSITIPPNPRRLPTNLDRWTDFEKRVKLLFRPLLDRKYPGLLPKDEFEDAIHGLDKPSSETEVEELARNAFEDPALRILRRVFGIYSRFYNHQTATNLGNPDRVFVRLDPPPPSTQGTDDPKFGRKTRLVIEFKTPWALDLPDDLAKEYNDNKADPDHKVVKAVHQLYGYMTWNDVQMGVLSTYTSTFFFEKDEALGLRVSRRYKNSDMGEESVVAALAYLCHYVSTKGSDYSSTMDRSRGTRVVTFDPQLPFLYEGSWDKRLKVPWKDMEIRLGSRLSQNYATVDVAELRHKKCQDSRYRRYQKLAVCKIYDLTSEESAAQAKNELDM